MSSGERPTLEIGPYRLEPDGSLWREQTRIALPPKETELLNLLVENRGRLVSKREVLDELWLGEDVGETSIRRCVRGLRRALEEGGRRGGTIETVHGRGYRLGIAIRPLGTTPGLEGDASLRVGVSPFEVEGPNPENAFLGAGVAGAVTDCLARANAEGITVIARQSTSKLRHGEPEQMNLARALRLDYLVTGWLQSEADGVRVHVELIRVRDESLVWSEPFWEPPARLPKLPARIARGVGGALGRCASRAISVRAARDATDRPKAYLALLHGQFAAQVRSERGVRRAIELYERATSWDPRYADPHAALADAHLMLAFRGYEAPLEIAPRVRALLERALALDRRSAAAYAALAYLRLAIDYEPAAAMRAVERALTIEPRHPRATWMRGQIHHSAGRLHEALAAYGESLDANPLDPNVAMVAAFATLSSQRSEEALVAVRMVTERDPEFALGHAVRAVIAASDGRTEEAARSAAIAEDLGRGDAATLGACAWAFAKARCTGRAAEIRAYLERRAARRYVGPSHLAAAALGLGDTEAAIEWLVRGGEQRCMYLPFVAVDPRFAPLRGDARFEEIVAIARGGHSTASRHPAPRSAHAARAKSRDAARRRARSTS